MLALLVLALAGALMLFSLASWSSVGGFAAAFAKPTVRFSLLLSVSTALVVALAALLLAVPVAHMLSRTAFRGKSFVEALLMLPLGLPPVAVGISILLLLAGPGSFIEQHFKVLFTFRGIIAAQLAVVFPIAVRVLKSGFDAVDPRYEHVARTLGLSPLSTLIRVTLPMAKHSVYAAFILSFLRAFGEFGATVTVAGAIPGKTATLPIAMYLAIGSGRFDEAATLVLLTAAVVVPLLTLFVALERGGGGRGS
jgi:molybdate transport system permease protein